MAFLDELRDLFERQERETVGNAFGGPSVTARSNYSITSIRDLILGFAPFNGTSEPERALRRAGGLFPRRTLSLVVANLVRFSYLIELTNITVGSTKMKTRWVPGLILMPQEGSFEPIRGSFEPGNDPRAATFEECTNIFAVACDTLCEQVRSDHGIIGFINDLNGSRRVPYEFPFTYKNATAEPVHTMDNICWCVNDDIRWLLKARLIIDSATGENSAALAEIKKSKIQVKIYKTDRSLTGKDKTNRAKRWEVLAGDFQHATITQCWSAERKITSDLVLFSSFPDEIKAQFISRGLISEDQEVTRCPVTFEPLDYPSLARAVLNYTHGVSDYQIGHLHPLKRGGIHDGSNVCWQSADGNRIQGPLTIEETGTLLDQIFERRTELLPAPPLSRPLSR